MSRSSISGLPVGVGRCGGLAPSPSPPPSPNSFIQWSDSPVVGVPVTFFAGSAGAENDDIVLGHGASIGDLSPPGKAPRSHGSWNAKFIDSLAFARNEQRSI